MFNRPAEAPNQLPGYQPLLTAFGLALAACLFARFLSSGSENGMLLWPAAGVAFAYGWRHGIPCTLPAALGVMAAGVLVGADIALIVSSTVATAASAAVSIWLLKRLNAWNPAEYRLQSTVRFMLVALLIGASIAALLIAGSSGFRGWNSNTIPSVWLAWGLGTVLLAPAVLAAFDTPGPSSQAVSRLGIDIPAVLLSLVLALAQLGLSALGQPKLAHLILFLYFPIVLWSALRDEERVHAVTLVLTALPLLGARAYQDVHHDGHPDQAIESTVLIFSAVAIAHVLQAVASDRRLALARVANQARQDMTTGLLNDRGMLAEFADRLAAPDRPNLGLIGVNLTNFDAVSDLCGPISAMQLEQSAAALLLRQQGVQFAARLSVGRYALLIECDTVAQVRNVARDVYAQLAGQLFAVEHGSLRLQVCVGGLQIDRHALVNSEDCLSSLADAQAIAASVRDPQLFVEPLSQSMIDSRRALQSKVEHLREAIRETRLELYAQPVVDPDAPEGSVSYEILTRLRDRDGGLIQPPEFLSLAVQSQMSVTLDRAVIQRSFEWLANNPNSLARTHKCSINLSGATMSDGSIADYIRQQRALCGIPADRIVFEITESEAIRNPSAASRLVDDLKGQGFGIALDDFGTGLATFEYLKRFPLDYLKIDGSFIRNLTTSPIDEEIVNATVRVARRLNLRTVAEHVHNESVHTRLREMGVVYMQGDLFGKALPIASMFQRFPDCENAQAFSREASAAPTVDGIR